CADDIVDVFFYLPGKRVVRCYIQIMKCSSVIYAETDDPAGDPVGSPERQALSDKIFGNVGSCGKSSVTAVFESLPAEGYIFQHFRKDSEGSRNCVSRIEKRLLIFLHVPVVCKWEAFHSGKQIHEIAVDPAGLAPHQLGNIGILFLRHDAGPGG